MSLEIKKHTLVENELNELTEKVKVISTKGLTKYQINKFIKLNAAKYFLQECLKVVQHLYQLKNTLNTLVVLRGLIYGNPMEYQKKSLKILLNQTAILHQVF